MEAMKKRGDRLNELHQKRDEILGQFFSLPSITNHDSQ